MIIIIIIITGLQQPYKWKWTRQIDNYTQILNDNYYIVVTLDQLIANDGKFVTIIVRCFLCVLLITWLVSSC